MGGHIEISSRANEGTKLQFTIKTRSSLLPLRGYNQKEIDSIQGKRVLIIADNLITRTVLGSRLTQLKLVPVIAEKASDALDILSREPLTNLVVIDRSVKQMNSAELAQSIMTHHPDIPVILLTHTGDESYREFPELFSSVITKPVKQHLLTKNILNAFIKLDKPSLTDKLTNNKLSENFSQRFPMRILVAEDDAMNQKLAIMVLKRLGYHPEIAENGKEVLEVVSHKKYDLILMDVQMPEMDGLEATRMIRLCLTIQPIIIAMTANAMQGDREVCLGAGMDDYISKPVNFEELVNMLEKWALQVKEIG
jgi:CheY-like chemotaxis protein